MLKFLIGGSPCTHWSIAQSKNRETEAQGEGWELFKNYLIALDKFKPDYFLYENNKSAAAAIKEQISRELNAPLQYINSALVSAQNRQRFYCHNFGDVPQPADRGILLKDILESGESWTDKAYCVTTRIAGAIPSDTLKRSRHSMVAENVTAAMPICAENGKAHCLTASMANKNSVHDIHGKQRVSMVAEDVAAAFPFGETNGKAYCLTSNYQYTPYPEHTLKKSVRSMAAEMVGAIANTDKFECLRATYYKSGTRNFEKKITDGLGYQGVCVRIGEEPCKQIDPKKVYRVEAGQIDIKGKLYPIKLPDGYYIIRKLTVAECCRLQTMPDDYCRAVSKTQAYKGLGNGWTAEVIIHLLSHALKGVPKNEKIVVLSMYDGIGTGRYCFDKLGYHNIEYHAYEIDEPAKQISMSNYPDIRQHGDAFGVRSPLWFLQAAHGKPKKTQHQGQLSLFDVVGG